MEPYLPLVLAALFGAAAPVIARRLPPPIATWLLSIGGLVAAAGSVAVLGFLAFTLLGRAPLLATQGHWSPTALQHADPVAVPVEVAAMLALAAVTVRVAPLPCAAAARCWTPIGWPPRCQHAARTWR